MEAPTGSQKYHHIGAYPLYLTCARETRLKQNLLFCGGNTYHPLSLQFSNLIFFKPSGKPSALRLIVPATKIFIWANSSTRGPLLRKLSMVHNMIHAFKRTQNRRSFTTFFTSPFSETFRPEQESMGLPHRHQRAPHYRPQYAYFATRHVFFNNCFSKVWAPTLTIIRRGLPLYSLVQGQYQTRSTFHLVH